MAQRRKPEEPNKPRRPPAATRAAREHQLTNLAYDLVEQKLREGTASSQETTHFLKMGSSREVLEQERLAREVELLEIKKETMASAARVEELMVEAIAAMRRYKGDNDVDERDDYED